MTEENGKMEIRQVHPLFAAEITGVDLMQQHDAPFYDEIRDALGKYGVIIIKDQAHLDDDGQIAFSKNFGKLQTSITIHREDTARRMKRDELTDLSNVNADGSRIAADDTRRQLQKPAKLWHSDNSFRSPPGLYTLLHGRIIPPEGGNTEFADMRAAYDKLDDAMKAKLQGLKAQHSLAWSRIQANSPPLSPQEAANIPESIQPLIRFHPDTGRKSLYLSSHARDIIGMEEAEGRALLAELTKFATQEQFVYSHKWTAGDFVIWDNRSTMHRATPFPEEKYHRDMRRTSVEDSKVALAA